MYIVIAGSLGFPVAMHRHETLTVPVPVTACPYIAGTRCRFHLDHAFRWRLRRDHFFDVFMMDVRSFMDHTLLDTA
jgi:hypothetical protein